MQCARREKCFEYTTRSQYDKLILISRQNKFYVAIKFHLSLRYLLFVICYYSFVLTITDVLHYRLLARVCACGPTGSLNIRHSLESDEGKYECVAENSVGVVYSYGANLYVRGERYLKITYVHVKL